MNYQVEYEGQDWVSADIEADSSLAAAKLYVRQDSAKRYQNFAKVVAYREWRGGQRESFNVQDVLPAIATMKCPYCGQEYPKEVTVCPVDAFALNAITDGGEDRTAVPSIRQDGPEQAIAESPESTGLPTSGQIPLDGVLDADVQKALDLRLARGEISHEEYAKTLGVLTQSAKTRATPKQPPTGPVAPAAEEATMPSNPNDAKACPQQPQPLAGCGTWVGAIFILLAGIGVISEIGGCDSTTRQGESNTSPKDPNVRHVGARGAVAGQNQHGRTQRLRPGTAVQLTGSTYGSQKVYLVEDGEFAGLQVPLGESDLEPQ